ncbi:hypothetical protein D2E24_1215 [Bifidobacterium samirii]|uniref:Uncharacterized protein n=1 Tax=Bifidobacterium samirii TaxID=2306974 RepID=A0A430FTT3_9BIFI|nr:hypothetical protein D2E24_1215 [Bifidobacterium samirii]
MYTVRRTARDQYPIANPEHTDHTDNRFYVCVSHPDAFRHWTGIPRTASWKDEYILPGGCYYVPSSRSSLREFSKDGYWIVKYAASIHWIDSPQTADSFRDCGKLAKTEYDQVQRMWKYHQPDERQEQEKKSEYD